jgi:signal peptidase I
VPPTLGGVGYVPFENLVGRAEVIFFSFDEAQKTDETGRSTITTNHIWELWKWPEAVRWGRLLKVL